MPEHGAWLSAENRQGVAQWRAHVSKWCIGSFIAFLALQRTAGSFWSESNRFFFHWRWSDAPACLLVIVMIGLSFWAGWELAGRHRVSRWLRGLAITAFVLFFGKVCIYTAAVSSDNASKSLAIMLNLIVVAGIVAYVFRPRLVIRVIRGTCLILSPILLIYALILFMAEPLEQTTRNLAPPADHPRQLAAEGPIERVVLVVFDEWSYARTFEGGDVRPEFSNLARISEKSIVFTEAYSPSTVTYHSMPSLLCGVAGTSSIVDETHHLTTPQGAKPVSSYSNMFGDMKQLGYETVLYGQYIPYADSFGQVFSEVISWDSSHLYGYSAWDTMRACMSIELQIWGTVIPGISYPYTAARKRYFSFMAQDIQARALARLAQPGPLFMVLHQSVPHAPYIFERSGLKETIDQDQPVLDAYLDNMAYADTLLGDLYDTAMADPSQKTLLLMLSDHSFRNEPDKETMPEAQVARLERHVPVLVTMTGQQQRLDCTQPFQTVWLKDILQVFLQGPVSPERFHLISQNYERETLFK